MVFQVSLQATGVAPMQILLIDDKRHIARIRTTIEATRPEPEENNLNRE